jgi:hypothetical protein
LLHLLLPSLERLLLGGLLLCRLLLAGLLTVLLLTPATAAHLTPLTDALLLAEPRTSPSLLTKSLAAAALPSPSAAPALGKRRLCA